MADIEMVGKLSILLSPIMVGTTSIWPAWRRTAVPYAVFVGGMHGIAATALLRHDWEAHENWWFLLPSLLLVLPVLLSAQAWWVGRREVRARLSKSDWAWQCASFFVGVAGVGAVWHFLGRGIP